MSWQTSAVRSRWISLLGRTQFHRRPQPVHRWCRRSLLTRPDVWRQASRIATLWTRRHFAKRAQRPIPKDILAARNFPNRKQVLLYETTQDNRQRFLYGAFLLFAFFKLFLVGLYRIAHIQVYRRQQARKNALLETTHSQTDQSREDTSDEPSHTQVGSEKLSVNRPSEILEISDSEIRETFDGPTDGEGSDGTSVDTSPDTLMGGKALPVTGDTHNNAQSWSSLLAQEAQFWSMSKDAPAIRMSDGSELGSLGRYIASAAAGMAIMFVTHKWFTRSVLRMTYFPLGTAGLAGTNLSNAARQARHGKRGVVQVTTWNGMMKERQWWFHVDQMLPGSRRPFMWDLTAPRDSVCFRLDRPEGPSEELVGVPSSHGFVSRVGLVRQYFPFFVRLSRNQAVVHDYDLVAAVLKCRRGLLSP